MWRQPPSAAQAGLSTASVSLSLHHPILRQQPHARNAGMMRHIDHVGDVLKSTSASPCTNPTFSTRDK